MAIEDDRKMTRILLASFFIVYVVTVLWFTVLCRPVREQPPRLELFWSYKRWLQGDLFFGVEILGNIAMFGPFGFMLGELLLEGGRHPLKRPVSAFLIISVCALLFSAAIEVSQLVFSLGLFEWDDFVSNTAGAMIGFGTCRLLKRKLAGEQRELACLMIHLLFAIVCIHILAFYTIT